MPRICALLPFPASCIVSRRDGIVEVPRAGSHGPDTAGEWSSGCLFLDKEKPRPSYKPPHLSRPSQGLCRNLRRHLRLLRGGRHFACSLRLGRQVSHAYAAGRRVLADKKTMPEHTYSGLEQSGAMIDFLTICTLQPRWPITPCSRPGHQSPSP
jgi:hypothetical protein